MDEKVRKIFDNARNWTINWHDGLKYVISKEDLEFLKTHISTLEGKIKELEDVNMSKGRVLTCVYCGMEYPQDTPAWGDKVLTDHIKVCEKHPIKKLNDDYIKLRKALVGLVGVDTKEELDAMEAQLRELPIPDVDRMNTINAITALRDTLGI